MREPFSDLRWARMLSDDADAFAIPLARIQRGADRLQRVKMSPLDGPDQWTERLEEVGDSGGRHKWRREVQMGMETRERLEWAMFAESSRRRKVSGSLQRHWLETMGWAAPGKGVSRRLNLMIAGPRILVQAGECSRALASFRSSRACGGDDSRSEEWSE